MRLERDTAEVAQHTGLEVTGDLVRPDLHGGGVDPDASVTGLVHRLVGLAVVGDLEAQVLGGLALVHAGVIEAVAQDLPAVGIDDGRVVADALEEEDAVAELGREVVVDLGALLAGHHRRVQDLLGQGKNTLV